MIINQFPAKFGRYILLDRLAAGGMAEVFRAKVTGVEQFERLLAIKCMLPQLLNDEQFVAMFRDEARLASQLVHANIVQIYEPGRLGERLYIAMELVNGRDLRHVLRSAKAAGAPLAPEFAAYVVCKSAEGLDFAHRKLNVDGQPLNLVHRDVSPQNLLVSYDGEVKVVDFGIAKAEARSTETQAGVLKGKFAYMAPEQVTGAPTDRRADIFALGSVLYEAVTGLRLFTGDTDLAVLEKVRSARLPNFRDVLPPGADEIAPILQKALARKPDDRYSFASEMAEDLGRCLIGDDRSIYGSKRAGLVMSRLYQTEIAQLSETLRNYVDIGPDDCVISVGEDRTAEHEAFQTFQGVAPGGHPQQRGTNPALTGHQSGSGVTNILRQQLPSQSATPIPPPRTVTISRTQQPNNTPRTQERVSQRLARAESERTSIDTRARESTRTSRVVRNIMVAFSVTFFVLGGLTLFIFEKMPKNGQSTFLSVFQDFPNNVKGFWNMPVGSPSTTMPPEPPPETGKDPPKDPSKQGDSDGSPHGYAHIKGPAGVRLHAFVDGEDMGTLPLFMREVPIGAHTIRLVEETTRIKPPPRVITKRFEITSKNTRKSPYIVKIDFDRGN